MPIENASGVIPIRVLDLVTAAWNWILGVLSIPFPTVDCLCRVDTMWLEKYL